MKSTNTAIIVIGIMVVAFALLSGLSGYGYGMMSMYINPFGIIIQSLLIICLVLFIVWIASQIKGAQNEKIQYNH